MGRRLRVVRIQVSENFYEMVEEERRRLQKKFGIKNLTHGAVTELMAKSKHKLPSLDQIKKNVRKKRFIK